MSAILTWTDIISPLFLVDPMLTVKQKNQLLKHMGPFSHIVHNMLSLKAPINTTADDKFCDISPF